MTTATKDINEAAVDQIAGTCRERINEMIGDLLTYVNASEAPGKMTIAISVDPAKDTPGAYWVNIVPSLAVKGLRTEAPATIELVGKQLQLKMPGME